MDFFSLNKIIKPNQKFTSNEAEFLQIATDYLEESQNYLQKGLKQLKKEYKRSIIYNPNLEYKRFVKWKENFTETFESYYDRFFITKYNHYSLSLLFSFINEQIETVIASYNSFLNEHNKLAFNKVSFSFEKKLFEATQQFNNLEKNTAISDDLPLQFKVRTTQLKTQRERELKNLLNKIKLKNLSEKKQEILLNNWFNSNERLFLKNEVKKVNWLNSPRQKQQAAQIDDQNIIELKNVYKYITNGITTNAVLKGVDLAIKSHDFIVILGPSGSGKTTLLNIISGMDRASSGSVIVNGYNMICLNDRKLTKFRQKYVGYIFQQYGLLPNLTVRENIEIGANLQPDPSKRISIDALLEAVGMDSLQKKLPNELSGGQQQRVSIARAFAKNPLLIFGDEPTGALDLEMTQIVLKQFLAIKKRYQTTMIIVTHNNLIANLADLVIYVADGKIKSLHRNLNPKQVEEIHWI